MKKLISILTILTLTTSSFSSIIACSNSKVKENEDFKKDKDGNSIWTTIHGLNNKSITSGDIWKEIKLEGSEGWNGKTRMKIMLDIMKIFNVSVLANAHKIDDKIVATFADWSDLKSLLTQGWNELTESVTDEIKRQKDEFKNKKQKTWKSEWNEFLNKNYDGKEDILFAEKLLNSSEKNATSVLTSILLSNQRELEEYKVKDISSWIQSLINATDKAEWKTKNVEQVKNINKSIANSSKLNSVDTIVNKLQANTNIKLVAELLSSGDLEIKSIPILDNEDKPKFLSSSIDGLTSVFQSFIMKKWFEVKKPLAVSQINFAFKSDSDKLANGVTDNDFDELTKTKINKFLSTPSSIKWEELMQTYKGTYASELVTLDNNSFTPIFKLAAYGLATDKITQVPVSISTKLTLVALLKNIDRKKPGTRVVTTTPLYTKVTINSIDFAAFIDDSGLHFLKIEGKEFLDDITTTNLTTGNYFKTKQLETIDTWNNVFLKQSMSEKAKIINKPVTKFNNWLGNNYLKWLQNQSYINANDENSKLKFKIEDAFKKFAELSTSTSTDSNEWWFWIFDFFKEYINKVKGIESVDWYKEYIKFSGNNGEWFNSILRTLESSINTNSLNEFINSLNKENKTINDYPNGYPKFNLEDAGFKDVIIKIRTATNNVWKIEK